MSLISRLNRSETDREKKLKRIIRFNEQSGGHFNAVRHILPSYTALPRYYYLVRRVGQLPGSHFHMPKM